MKYSLRGGCMLLFAALIFTGLPIAFAQDAVSSNEDGATADDEVFLQEALAAGYRGEARTAIQDLEDYLSDYPKSRRALAGLAAFERMRGRYAEAQDAADELLALEPESGEASIALARIQGLRGARGKAEDLLRRALEREPASMALRAELAELLFSTGRREEAREVAKAGIESPEGKDATDGDALCLLSRLFLVVGDRAKAAQAAVYADEALNGRQGKDYRYARYEPLLLLGELYRGARLGLGAGDRGSGNRALESFRDALKICPGLPEAHLGIARTRFYAFNLEEAHAELEQALAVNPVYAPALALKAHLFTLTRQYEEAEPCVAAGLAADPGNPDLLAERAALHLFRGDAGACREDLARALRTDPTCGEAFYEVAELLVYHYRFPEAESYLKECLEKDPEYDEAYILLARVLANLGREEEARDALKTSARKDPFDYPWRNNMLRVLSEIDGFREEDSPQFHLRMDGEEERVLEPYLLDAGARSLAFFRDHFDFQVTAPLLLEVFPDHEDFEVRTIGFTGLGALGACFGEVVTLLSPRAEPFRGNFNFACTLHHELCHVFTMQMSRYRIPRWFTEGISVFEEGNRKRAWRRNQDMELYMNLCNDTLCRMESFDQDFMGPRVLFAYAQAGVTVEYLIDRFGIEGLRAAVRAFGDDQDTAGVFRSVFGLELDRFEEDFKAWLWERKFSSVRCFPHYGEAKRQEWTAAARERPEDKDAQCRAAFACFQNDKGIDALYFLNRLLKLDPGYPQAALLEGLMALEKGNKERAERCLLDAAEAGAEDLFAWRSLGLLALERKDVDEAVRRLEKAEACFPSFIGTGSPRPILAELYLKQGREEAAAEEMAGMIDEGLQDPMTMRSLAALLTKQADFERAAAYLGLAVQIDPFQRLPHLDLARLERLRGAYTDALREVDTALAVDPALEAAAPEGGFHPQSGEDENALRADLYAERGEILLALGDREGAAAAADKSLALQGGHEGAQALKKKLEADPQSEPPVR